MTDKDYMLRALALAAKGQGRVSPNPMVGAVIVKNNKILAEGYHRRCGGDHAEVNALKKIQSKAQGATLYVTLEPCHHHGRTPPCVDAVLESGISRVVIAMKDPNPKTGGKSIAKLRRSKVDVTLGTCQAEAQRINEFFITYINQSRPFVVAKCAQTLDGKIATSSGESKWITSEKTRRYARQQRDHFDAILVGIDTVLADDPQLTGSRVSKVIQKIILDSRLRISPKARLFKDTDFHNIHIVCSDQVSAKKRAIFENKGVRVWTYPLKQGRVPLSLLYKDLVRHEISSILIEGGAKTVGEALRQEGVDKMHIYIAPSVMGDDQGRNSVSGLNVKSLKSLIHLNSISIENLGSDIKVQGYVHRNH